MMKLVFLLLLSIFMFQIVSGSVDVLSLLHSMTLEEKVGQMTQLDIQMFIDKTTGEVKYDAMRDMMNITKFGSLFDCPFSMGAIDGKVGWTALEWREVLYNIQMIAEDLGIPPIMYGLDSIHGATYVYGAALFPQSINIGASFNPNIAYDSGLITGKDTRAAGVPWIFSPVLGLGLQPLWARFGETFGEDPYVAAQMGSKIIEGLQSDDNVYEGFPPRGGACMKHFIGYSKPNNGHDRSPVTLADRLMRQLYLPSFKAAVDAGVMSAMESYNSLGGVPMVSSTEYLTNLLRYEMNFTGPLVTDYTEIENLFSFHRVSATEGDAVALSISETSIDMSMVPDNAIFSTNLISLVKSGVISINRVDESVLRILEMKNKLGLLETPIPPREEVSLTDTVGSDGDYELSLDAARESIVLLSNGADNDILPIRTSSRVALGGPTCDSLPSQSGGWSFHWQGALSNDEFTKGVTIKQGFDMYAESGMVLNLASPSVDALDLSEINMNDVLDQIRTADPPIDYIVVCLGEGTYAEKPGDIDDLALATGQVQYVEELATVGIPIVTVLVEGRPRLLSGIPSLSSAVMQSGLPGPMGGQAVAEIIYGRVNPSGKLPYTYPKAQANTIYPYHRKVDDLCTDPNDPYSYVPCEVEWVFGTGLGYVDFTYDFVALSKQTINENEVVGVNVTIKNNGAFANNIFDVTAGIAMKHTVLLFLFDIYRRVTPEYKLLRRFEKVQLEIGESITLEWELNAKDLEYVGIDSRIVLESGQFAVGMGHESDCRNFDYIDGKNAPGQFCQLFDLNLTSGYNSVCQYGCEMWESGICGEKVDYSTCFDTCVQQAWDWNYVNCLETTLVNAHCASGVQCYDAFGTEATSSSGGSNRNNEDFSEIKVVYIGIGAGLAGVLVGIFFTERYHQWIFTRNRKRSVASGRPTVFDRVVPSGHLDFEEQYESLTTPFSPGDP